MLNFDVDIYREDGFSSAIDVFGEQEVAQANGQFETWSRDGVFPEHPRDQQNLHLTHEFIWKFVVDARLLDMVRAIIGDDILLLGSKLRCKLPHQDENAAFPWHQDVAKWKIEPPLAHSAWIAFDVNNDDNGCLYGVPGSHKLGRIESVAGPEQSALRNNYVVPDECFDAGDARPFDMGPGQIRFFDARLIHGSWPNRSSRRRCNLLVRYVSPEISCSADYTAILVSGQDRHNNFKRIEAPYS